MNDPTKQELTDLATAALERAAVTEAAKEAAAGAVREKVAELTKEGKIIVVSEEEKQVLRSYRLWSRKRHKRGASFHYQIGEQIISWADRILNLRTAAQDVFEAPESRERVRRALQDHKDDVDIKLLCLWDETPVEEILAKEDGNG